jgi:hypothetical protein
MITDIDDPGLSLHSVCKQIPKAALSSRSNRLVGPRHSNRWPI